MKRLIAILLVLATSPVFGGLTYDFKSVTSGRKPVTLSGTAAVEGKNMRLDFESGDGFLFKDATVLISKDGGETFLVLDPAEKTYYEFALQQILTTAGNVMKAMGDLVKMDVKNQTVNVQDMGAAETIEGYPTRKIVVSSSYDLSMKIMGMSTDSKVQTTSEAWVTNDIPVEYITFIQQKGFKTGFEGLDKIIEAQGGKVQGFPLKQVVTTKNSSGKQSETNVVTNTMTNFRKGTVPASKFEVPAGYTKKENPSLDLSNLPQPRD